MNNEPKSETPRANQIKIAIRSALSGAHGYEVSKAHEEAAFNAIEDLETELNAAKAENARLTARMAKIEDELTAAWMCGFHKRDDEVARLTKELSDNRDVLNLCKEIIGRQLGIPTPCSLDDIIKATEPIAELRTKLAESEKGLVLAEAELGQTNENLINRIAEGEAVTIWQKDVESTLLAVRQAIDAAKGVARSKV